MRCSFILLLVTSGVVGSPADAERGFVPSIGSETEVCSERPDEPDWMRNIGLREAYKRVLIQDIYRAQNMERIVATGDCACESRFPPWNAAEAEFHEQFADAKRWEMLEASNAYNTRANAVRLSAMAICEAQGNW